MKEVERLGLNVEQALLKPYQEQGNTISFLILENHLAAIVALGDVVKQKQRIYPNIERKKITPVMLTGDNKTLPKQ